MSRTPVRFELNGLPGLREKGADVVAGKKVRRSVRAVQHAISQSS